jgi:hypothetical protein
LIRVTFVWLDGLISQESSKTGAQVTEAGDAGRLASHWHFG